MKIIQILKIIKINKIKKDYKFTGKIYNLFVIYSERARTLSN